MGSNLRDEIRSESWKIINPILGFNLEGLQNQTNLNKEGTFSGSG